ncbi:4'-phosphopantetheinyl transferase superfamily protein [Streptomyces sp. NPDC032472]|uniref:4'-phosphopantetheinyl transferase family protein n=1 Tax=Streptomyces sp. NPDC032472 TaxID=3155018 RepID=UPI0033CF0085
MLSRLLPAAVAVVACRWDPPEAQLYPEEAAVVRHAVDKRRREFTTVRHCARRALGRLGLPHGPVLPDRHGAPRWPSAVVGSLTHCEGYRAAALARASELAMLGIDVEPHEPLPAGVLDAIARPAERSWIRSAPPGTHWDRLLFSAKEAVYKAWYPRFGEQLEFTQAELRLDPAGTFTARLLTRPADPTAARGVPDPLTGRWLTGGGLVFTALAVPSPGPAPLRP